MQADVPLLICQQRKQGKTCTLCILLSDIILLLVLRSPGQLGRTTRDVISGLCCKESI